MLFRIRLFRACADYVQSNYMWFVPVMGTEGSNIAETAENIATDFGLMLINQMAGDVRLLGYSWRGYDDTTLQPQTAWITKAFDSVVIGNILGQTAFPELCVQVEFRGASGKIVPHRFGFIPELFLSALQNINVLGLSAWDAEAPVMLTGNVHASLAHATVEPMVGVYTSPEVTTLNKRRSPVPFNLAGPRSP